MLHGSRPESALCRVVDLLSFEMEIFEVESLEIRNFKVEYFFKQRELKRIINRKNNV